MPFGTINKIADFIDGLENKKGETFQFRLFLVNAQLLLLQTVGCYFGWLNYFVGCLCVYS